MTASSPSMFRARVRPSDCILLVGIPLTEPDFQKDLAEASPTGAESAAPRFAEFFAQQCKKKGIKDNDKICKTYFELIANKVIEKCKEFRALGVAVSYVKDESELKAAMTCGSFAVVILLTHSGWVPLVPADLPNVSKLISFLRTNSAGSQVLRSLLEDLEQQFPELTEITSGGELPSDLQAKIRKRICELTREAQEYYDRRSHWEREEPEPGARPFNKSFTRALLEFYIPDHLLRPCRAVEFREGMRTAKEVIEAIQCDFSGVLHLISCSSCLYSIGLADPKRTYLVIMEQSLLVPRNQLLLLHCVLNDIAATPGTYLAVQEWIRSNIPDRRPPK